MGSIECLWELRSVYGKVLSVYGKYEMFMGNMECLWKYGMFMGSMECLWEVWSV
jgi:hypothetical protein